MDDSPTEWELRASATCRPNGRVSARCLDWPRYNLPVEPSLRLRRSPFPGNGIPSPETTGTLLAGHEPSTSTKILPSLTSYFARSSASASESTLMAACGWRALIARMASPLSGMATSDHSCSGEPPPGFGSTVTIFHPAVMRLRLTSSFVPAYPTASTQRSNQFTTTSLPGRGRRVLWVDLNCSLFAALLPGTSKVGSTYLNERFCGARSCLGVAAIAVNEHKYHRAFHE
jgi:hypothetical protein